MLNIIHKPSASDPTKVYEQIAGLTPLPKSMKAPPAINPVFLLSYDDFDTAAFNGLPDFIKQKMQSSLEYQAIANPHERSFQHANEIEEPIDDLPF